MKKISMIIAPTGFQDVEFGVPYEYFKEHGAIVDVYSTKKGIASGVFGKTFDVQLELKDLNVDNYDAIVFVGGPGTTIVRSDFNAAVSAKKAFEKNKIVAAICWSPTILAQSGILKDKDATVWAGDDKELGMDTEKYLELKGAYTTGDEVTVDGNIITANGPKAAQEYAKAIWKKLNQ